MRRISIEIDKSRKRNSNSMELSNSEFCHSENSSSFQTLLLSMTKKNFRVSAGSLHESSKGMLHEINSKIRKHKDLSFFGKASKVDKKDRGQEKNMTDIIASIKRECFIPDIKRRSIKKLLYYKSHAVDPQEINYQEYRIWRQIYMKENLESKKAIRRWRLYERSSEDNKKSNFVFNMNSDYEIFEFESKESEKIIYTHNRIKEIFGAPHNLLQPQVDYLKQEQFKEQQVPQTEELKVQKIKKKIPKSKINKKAVFKMANCPKYCYQQSTSNLQAPISLYLKFGTNRKKIIKVKSLATQNFQNQQKYKWVHIDPKKNNILSVFHSYNYIDNLNVVDLLIQGVGQCSKEFVFASFLKALYEINSDRIIRNFNQQNQLSESYLIWLCVEGQFQLFEVQPYFPVNEQLKFPCIGHVSPLWLLILMKCMCWIYKSMSDEVLSKIRPQQIYKHLTGIPLSTISRQQIKSSCKQQFEKQIHKSLDQQNICLMLKQVKSKKSELEEHEIYLLTRKHHCKHTDQFSNNPHEGKFGTYLKHNYNTYEKENQFVENQSGNQKCSIFAYCLDSDQIFSIVYEDRVMSNVLILAPNYNMFHYNFSFDCNVLSQLQVHCSLDQQILFSSSQPMVSSEQIYIHIYECIKKEGHQKASSPENLKLRAKKQVRTSLSIRLRKGYFRIFVSDKKEKMNDIFTRKPYHNKTNDAGCQMKTRYQLSLMSTEEIAVVWDGSIDRYSKNAIEDLKNTFHFRKFQQSVDLP